MDPVLLRQWGFMFCVVAVQWFSVAVAPLVALGYLPRPGGWELLIAVICVAYCFYTGYRAWQRAWRARFILRLIVPTCLLLLSCMAVWVDPWAHWSTDTGSEPHRLN
jgi:hypothetical protein